MRPVVWKEDKRFLEMDPMNARFWSHEDQRPNWTIWDEIHRGNLPLLATHNICLAYVTIYHDE